jgi:hypothetical protein
VVDIMNMSGAAPAALQRCRPWVNALSLDASVVVELVLEG